MSSAQRFQEQLLACISGTFHPSMPEVLHDVFMNTPRHLFVRWYRLPGGPEWYHVTDENLEQHLATVYQDSALALYEDNGVPVSTISQPSLVLRMLRMLDIRPGQRVLEIGTASGWNAAMLGRLVGDRGEVYSVEIIPEMAARARESLAMLGRDNVHVIDGDGGFGYAPGAPYDRVVFTVGSYDLPRAFYEQTVDGGLLLMVLKHRGGGDALYLFRKNGDHFESLDSLQCGFVSLTGQYRMEDMDPIRPEQIPYWNAIRDTIVSQQPFWWGGRDGSGSHAFMWKTMGFRSFLSIVEPERYEVLYKGRDGTAATDVFFGLCDHEEQSATIARNDTLTTYGSPAAEQRFRRALAMWVDLGMPGANNFHLKAYPGDTDIAPGRRQWLTRRRDSQFLWELSGAA